MEQIIPNQSRQGLHIQQARLHFVLANVRREFDNSDLYVSSQIILCYVHTIARITAASLFALYIRQQLERLQSPIVNSDLIEN